MPLWSVGVTLANSTDFRNSVLLDSSINLHQDLVMGDAYFYFNLWLPTVQSEPCRLHNLGRNAAAAAPQHESSWHW